MSCVYWQRHLIFLENETIFGIAAYKVGKAEEAEIADGNQNENEGEERPLVDF